jgi:hypothetical protein
MFRPHWGEDGLTEDGRVRPKHVLIEFKKWMCYIDGQKNKYTVKWDTVGKRAAGNTFITCLILAIFIIMIMIREKHVVERFQ